MIDYGIVVKKGEPETDDNVGTLDETRPLSYIGCISPEQGEMWYRTKYPDLPDDFYGIIARYTWGNPQTKKSIKNEVKKVYQLCVVNFQLVLIDLIKSTFGLRLYFGGNHNKSSSSYCFKTNNAIIDCNTI